MIEREIIDAARVARLATVTPSGAPHLVPIVFAAKEDRILTPIDHKPKRTLRVQRLVNIAHEPRVTVLIDYYDDDWTRLWWVRADGVATVLESTDPRHSQAAALLATRYRQYREHPIEGPIIDIAVTNWSSWSGAD